MATGQPQKSFSEIKNSRRYREAMRKNSRQLSRKQLMLEHLEDRRMMAVGPNLVAILPNSGALLLEGDIRHVAPKDLTFRFAEGQSIDATTVATGIKITRGGLDHTIGGADDVVITPGFIGLGDTSREVVMRFASTLPDDVYRIQIIGAGVGALRDIAGNPFNNGSNLTRNFTLDLGAQVVAIVPQPVVRTGTTLSQQRNQIVVYFNNDDLNPLSAQNPQFYRLYANRNTLDPADDVEILPTGVLYDPVADTATLTFSAPLEQLFTGTIPGDIANSFRLRIGTSETARPTALTTVLATNDPGSTFTLSQDLGASLTGGTQGGVSLIHGRIVNNDLNTTDDQLYDLDWPGANDEPGHRHIPVEDHLQFGPDATDGITTVFYNFQNIIGVIPDGIGGSQTAFNLITDNQKQRAREIFDLYNRYSGIQFIETANQGITVATGDMRAINPFVTTGINHPYGNSDIPSQRAIMDNAETWDDTYGSIGTLAQPSWMAEAMQQIGRVLGLGYSFDLPPLTINGADNRLGTAGVPLEPVFPGDHDIVHMRHLYRPESKDIDMYRFTVDATGVFRAETFAERLADSSLLDTYLKLYKVGIDGVPVDIAQNDDYFSKDSQIELTLEPGTYYLGVSAKGNNAYDPNVVDSGIGGATQGDYQLKFDFRKSATVSLVDTTGTSFDGESDGNPGGVYNFWFKAAAPKVSESVPPSGTPRTIFVDKAAAAGGNGSLTTPYNTISTALTNARQYDIVRIVGNDNGNLTPKTPTKLNDDLAYHLGFNLLGNALDDGTTLSVPKNVTVMVDAGAIFQLRRAQINAGSTNPAIASDRSGGALQILGTPTQSVYFTSYNEEKTLAPANTNIGFDSNPFTTTPAPGDWGGISFKNDLDRADGRYVAEDVGVFMNYVNHADIRFGGGQVDVDSVVQVVNPVHMTDARPTVSYNTITRSADAAMSANPDSFEETNFAAPRFSPTAVTSYTIDYKRVGPEIHGNSILNNSINGMFVRAKTPAGNQLEELTVAGRFDDADIVHVIQENLFITGTPGGPTLEIVAPPVNLVVISRLTTPAGAFSAGQTVEYKLVYVDLLGNEGLPSASTAPIAVTSNNSSIRLTNMPIPSGNFVARRLYRRINGSGGFELVDQIPAQVTTFIDRNQTYHGTTRVILKNDANPVSLSRPRLDGSLVIDPTIVVKSDGSRFEVGIGANLIAEGYAGQEIVFTSVADDRYGAGGTFDTRNDNSLAIPQAAAAGDWGGVFFSANSSGSIAHAVIAYGGGLNRIQGSFAGFNAVEVHQADVRIADSEFEFNASGIGGQAPPSRFGRGFNGDSLIFIRAAQPVIVNNNVHDNSGAFVNVNANAMNNDTVVDLGRQRGPVERVLGHYDNNGPLIAGNKLTRNDTNGLIVRGGTLTTESVWDDSDIVHVLFDPINIPDFHTFGGLRLESQPTESLVIKAGGPNAGITANGRPLEMADRIGGRLEVLGQPGFPVILTSISDDSASAGFNLDGQPTGDTNNDGFGILQGVFGTLPAFPAPSGPLLVTASNNATQLVTAMNLRGLPPGVTIPTTTYTGAATAAGTYVNGDAVSLEIAPQGIILTSGTAVIPATNTDPSFSTINNGAGDVDLTAIAGTATFDAAVLTITIDVTAASGIRSGAFDFQFGSDEYSESIGSQFNDVFGGFINGGAATNFVRDSQGNIVSINNGFFNIDNENPPFPLNIEFDGMTSGLTARFPLIVGTNVLKLAVGDAFDRFVDSGALISDLRFSTQDITTGVGSRPQPGDWEGLTIDKYASDRNVAEILEQEAPNGTAPGANSTTSNAQFLGAIGPHEKAGDDNRRLGFTVHGLINAINDVDVYSFTADAGTEVWIDIDRTTHALDSVVELIDNDGNVLARSNNSGAEASGAESLGGIARRLEKSSPYEGDDMYTTNPRDAGFRVVLPGPNNTTNTYHVRVRSSSSDLTDVFGGDSLGAYQLQVRLRELDEFSGSTVQFADVRYATVGIQVLGQPTHSPLSGEAGETAGANDNSTQAQNIGNLLNTDRGSLGVAGLLSAPGDVDWYRLSVNYDAIQSVFEQPEDPSPENWFATIFDIDYADGFSRPNTIINVYDANLNLILSSRDSNVANDRPRPLSGADVTELDRGSSGAADPFIGVAELPQGNYFVSVSSDAIMPREFQQYFQAGAANNPLFRLEPINSSHRIVEDHIYIPPFDPVPPDSTAFPPDVDDGEFLSPGGAAVPFHLGDVGLYVVREARELASPEISQVITVDPFTGAREVTVGTLPFDIGDAAFRNDFNNLFSFSLDTGEDGEIRDDDSAHYLEINQGTAATTDLGANTIETYELDASVPPAPVRAHLSNGTRVGYGIQFDAMDFGEVWSPSAGDGFRGQRLVAVGHRGEADIPGANQFLQSRDNIVYQMDLNNGDALVGGGGSRVVGAATNIFEVGEIVTSARTRAPEATTVVPVVPATVPPTVTTTTNITDGMTFTVDDGFGITTFEFDGGPELLQNINPTQGRAVRDGDFFLLDPDDPTDPLATTGNETLLQFESGTAIKVTDTAAGTSFPDNIPAAVPPALPILPGSLSITDTQGLTRTFEFDREGNLSNAASIRVDVSGSLNAQGISGLLVAAINGQTSATWLVTAAFVGDRIRLTNDTVVSVTQNIATLVSPVGSSGNAPVLQALDGSLTIDGTQFQVGVNYLNAPTTYVFEFSDITLGPDATPPGVGITAIPYTQGMTDLLVANAMNNAIRGLNGGNPNLPMPLTTVLGDSRVSVNGARINAVGTGFADINSGIVDLTTTLLFVPIGVEDDFLAPQIGIIVAGTLGSIGPPVVPPVVGIVNSSTRYTASADGSRINFPPINTATKDPVGDLNISGVPFWNKVLGAASGVSSILDPVTGLLIPVNETVIFGAADTATQIAAAMAAAITSELQTSAGITATSRGPFVTLSDGILSAPNPPFNTQGQGPGGRVTGIAIRNVDDGTSTENVIYAITNRGGLFRVTADLFLNQVIDPADPAKWNQVNTTFLQSSSADLNGINFQGLTFGPRTVEGRRYEDLLFGITDQGRIYAFNTAGVLQPIFANGETSIATGIANARGLDFTNLDSNLWHTTTSRGGIADPGHGINTPFDDSRVSQTGVRSFQFGRDLGGNYFAPGGSYGTIVSTEFDLTGYSSADQPVLYFNYRADTENRNALIIDPVPPFPMLDAFRVSIAGDDGDWLELGTNNSARGAGVDEYSIYPKIQELFDNVNGFRQVRIDLADFAGQEHLRLRWDFTTGGELNLGNIQTTGEELRATRGNQILDGDVFEYDGRIDPITEDKIDGDLFEFQMGFSFQTPSATAINDGEFFSVDDNLADATPAIQFEFDKNGIVTFGRRPIVLDNTMSGTQVAGAIAQEITNAFVTIVPVFLNTNFVQLPEAENVTSSFASALRRVVSGHTLVIPHTKSTGTPIQDGETFTVNDGRNPPRTFEYDLNGSVAAGNVAIVITRFMPENTIALRTYNAIAGALPDAVARYTTGARVGVLSALTITQSAVHAVRLDIDATGIGVFPGHTAVVVDRSFSRDEIATAMNDVLEQFYYDQQILAVAGNLLSDGVGGNFVLDDGINPAVTFQFDTGYVMNIPAGGGNPSVNPHINDGDYIRLNLGGTTLIYEFDKDGILNNFAPPPGTTVRGVQITNASSQGFAARALSTAMNLPADAGLRTALSINPFWNGDVISGSRVQIGGTDPLLVVEARNAANAIINTFPRAGIPGTTNPAFIPVHFQPSANFRASDVAQQIRNAINLSPINTVDGVVASVGAALGANQRRVQLVGPDLTLAAGSTGLTMELGNNPANTVANNVVKQYGDLIRVITHTVYDAGPLGLDNFNASDLFGNFNSNLRFQNNGFEGIYLDDIIIGFAERGEIGTGPNSGGAFDPNPLADPLNIANGSYQLEVRRGPEFGIPNPLPPPDLLMFRTFNTNDLLTRDHQMVAPAGADLRDGETFILGDGVNALTFEFNDLSVTSTAITPGNVRINYRSNFTSPEVARAIQAAVNGPDAQAVLKLQATIGDGTLNSLLSTSNKVNLAGPSTYKLPGTIDENGVVVGLATERNDLINQALATNFDGNLFVGTGTIGDNPTLSVNRATQGMDVDLFSIDLAAGQIVRIDVDAVTLGSNLDSVLRIFDASGNPVILNALPVISDDQLAPGETRIPIGKNPNTGLPLINTIDPYLNFTAPASGLYYVGVSAFGNSTYNPVTGGGLVNATFLSRLGAYQLNISTFGATAFDDISNQNTFDEEFGDKNLFRDQGQIILQGNKVSNASQFGIVIDSGVRVPADGFLPHQGPDRNLREPNVQRLVPGVVVVNNTIYDNRQGGILFSGDPLGDAPVPFGRIINNTLVGIGGTIKNSGVADIGISVTDNASPTLLNNAVVNFRQGISVDVSSRTPAFGGTSLSGTILGGTLYQGNTANSNVGLGTGSDDFPIVLGNTDPLFVSFANKNFYLKEGSQAIDSSIDTLLDRPALVTVTDPLGISQSPILAPDRDGVGQKRVDDPNVKFTPPGGGFGENVAKDRGSIDRVDFTGPTSRLINPQDNDALGLDNDPADTIVVLQNQVLTNFSVQLIDAFDPFSPLEGSGIDDISVTARDVKVTATTGGVTRTLVQGLDYAFSYDATNNLIRLNPLGGLWPLSTTYKITLDNDPAADGAVGSANRTNGIFDLAGNVLLPNHDSGPDFGLVTYTIFLGSALDYGDAPDPTFPTLTASTGAAHQIKANVQLGLTNGADTDGQPSVNADLDTSDDGVTNIVLTPGSNSQVTVNASVAAKLDAWLDLNKDGDWDDAGEHIIDGTTPLGSLVAGDNVINFPLPLGPKGTTYARFRMSSTGIATPTGVALDGEVEDYKVTLTGPAFQNPLNDLDVNGDGFVSPIDALRIINFINRYKDNPFFTGAPNFGNMPLPNPFAPTAPDFLDTNGDGFVSPVDSNRVITYLNSNAPPPTGEGEGEEDGMSLRSLATGSGGTVDALVIGTAPDQAIPAVIYANSSVVVEVKNPAPCQNQLDDQLFGSGQSLIGDNFQPVIDELHPSSHREKKLEGKSRQRHDEDDSWDDLLGDLAADIGKNRRES